MEGITLRTLFQNSLKIDLWQLSLRTVFKKTRATNTYASPNQHISITKQNEKHQHNTHMHTKEMKRLPGPGPDYMAQKYHSDLQHFQKIIDCRVGGDMLATNLPFSGPDETTNLFRIRALTQISQSDPNSTFFAKEL